METEFHHAWLILIGQRDALYIMMAAVAAICLLWYWLGRFWLTIKWVARIALGAGLLALGMGWAWGIWRWLWV